MEGIDIASTRHQMPDQTDIQIGPTLKALPDNIVVRLDNGTCIYCGVALTKDTTAKEHVIGRRFVPKGKLGGYWNLIVNACQTCNCIKSDLENDISAITMQPDVFGCYGHEDEVGASEAVRKASKAYSRRTNKPIRDSHEKVNVKMPLGEGASVSFQFTSPPQIDQHRVFELARFQIMGFFYWITFDQASKRGRFWRDGFHPVLEASRSDWGNTSHRAFSEAVVAWEPRVFATSADGFFKIAIRKHPDTNCWSWALEWNHALRVIGFCGKRQAALDVASDFPKLEVQTISQGPERTLCCRIETPLAENEDDKLFYWDGEAI